MKYTKDNLSATIILPLDLTFTLFDSLGKKSKSSPKFMYEVDHTIFYG